MTGLDETSEDSASFGLDGGDVERVAGGWRRRGLLVWVVGHEGCVRVGFG